ncbi:hypothetical protein T265_11286 [Opisthorchis viverrini]|uniref:Uncharacterized protein n=1 Tax=Opisthorchis viverrini TaxID=6198 RepID=A0A074ZY28_OPIVI|nr:hypothetical protein T265_11286 [Opisthorchis viverrini]KER20089.1 hypothetical protein T265_11286 [Opisthorchis viverrini]
MFTSKSFLSLREYARRPALTEDISISGPKNGDETHLIKCHDGKRGLARTGPSLKQANPKDGSEVAMVATGDKNNGYGHITFTNENHDTSCNSPSAQRLHSKQHTTSVTSSSLAISCLKD